MLSRPIIGIPVVIGLFFAFFAVLQYLVAHWPAA